MDGRLQAGHLPLVDRRSTIAIRLLEKEVPFGIQRVDLELVILVVVAVGVDEDLKVIVLKDDRVMLGQRAARRRVLPEARRRRNKCRPRPSWPASESGARTNVSLNVDERISPRCRLPRILVELAVNLDRRRGAIANVALGRGIRSCSFRCGWSASLSIWAATTHPGHDFDSSQESEAKCC